MAAEESILQMANGSALELLGQFVCDPSKLNASRLVLIPSLLNVLLFHDGQYPSDLLSICSWLYDQGRAILDRLTVHESESPSTMEELDWQKVSYHLFSRNGWTDKFPNCRQGATTASHVFAQGQNIRLSRMMFRLSHLGTVEPNAPNTTASMGSGPLLVESWRFGAHTVYPMAFIASRVAKDAMMCSRHYGPDGRKLRKLSSTTLHVLLGLIA